MSIHRFRACVTLSCFVLASRGAYASKAPAKAPEAKPEVIARGDAMSTRPAMSVDEAVKQGAAHDGKVLKLTGEVKTVCQQKGCWFALAGKGGEHVRITSKGYKFFVPTNTGGRTATVEGVFKVGELDVKTAQHYEDDRVMGTAEKPRKITAPQKEFSMAATAVEMK